MITQITTNPSIAAVFRWLKIREENGIPVSSVEQLQQDAQHSSLLQRLLSGKEPFDKVPPQRFNYPWYALLEQGLAEESDVSPEDGVIAICRYYWTILETIELGSHYLVRAGIAPFSPNLEPSTWEVIKTSKKTPWGSTLWSIKRYNDQYGMQNLSSSQSQRSLLQEEGSETTTKEVLQKA